MSSLWKHPREHPCLFHYVRMQRNLSPRRGPSPNHTETLVSDFQYPEWWEVNMFFKQPRVWYSVLAAWVAKTVSFLNLVEGRMLFHWYVSLYDLLKFTFMLVYFLCVQYTSREKCSKWMEGKKANRKGSNPRQCFQSFIQQIFTDTVNQAPHKNVQEQIQYLRLHFVF